jgi:alpha-1,3-rhamnosyl/mannosyltransferase
LLGFVSDSDLTRNYATCCVCAYPSLCEGFGLPVIEAMAAGAPVVTSTTTALPEIAGGNAFLVDPKSEESIIAGIKRALDESPADRARRVESGRKWASSFTWQNAAAEYVKIYRELL